jgi:hypothetical protein
MKETLSLHGFEIIDTQINPPLPIKSNIVSSVTKESFMQKFLRIKESRGLSYLFKRALILPLHFFVMRVYKNYPTVNFVCRKQKFTNEIK